MTAPLPAGTLTFVFTDIEGSTKMVKELGTERFRQVLQDHGRIVRGAFEANRGHSVRSEGDSFFYVFDRPTEAVAAAAAAQKELAAHTFPEGAVVRVRMGMHTGEASLGTSESGTDYVGYDVHRAARIAASGHGGQILLSAATREIVRDTLPVGVTLRDMGLHRFKDLARPERIHQLVVAGLAADFPRLRTLDAVSNNLPVQLTSFVGREEEIKEGMRLLEGTRLLTLTGPGGTGKTRLSLQIAAAVTDTFPGGVTFVPLAPIADPDHVAPAIVRALGLEQGNPRPHKDRLIDHLAGKRVLLVLDNFEQILAAAPLVAELLRACPELKVITSSRAPLHISGEQELPVPPLDLPDPRAAASALAVSQFEAVRLFIERAVAVQPGFRVTNDNAPAVAEICARLDGLPLAIELAAARVKLLPPAAILTRLQSRLGLLQSGSRDLPARQQTLRGAIAWSYDLLDEVKKRLFARFSVFVGGATLEDIEAVCGGDGLGGNVLEELSALVDQSLVRQDHADDEPRAFMLETIREYASERLGESPEAETIRGRHAERFRALANDAEPHLARAERKVWLMRLEREHDNLRAALQHSTKMGDAERALCLGAALWRFWQIRGHLAEGRDHLEQALALPGAAAHPGARERALEGAGGLAYWQGELETMRRHYQDALALTRQIGDKSRIANALYNLSFTIWMGAELTEGRVAEMRAVLDEGIALAREVGDLASIAHCLWARAGIASHANDLADVERALNEAIPIFRRTGDLFGLAWALHTKGTTDMRLGNLPGARRALNDMLALLAEARDVSGAALALGDHAQLALAEGDRSRAIRLAGASAALKKLCGAGLVTIVDVLEKRSIETTDEDKEPWEEGLAMSLDEAVAHALRS